MTVLGCKWHPSSGNVGVCAHCLRESLRRLAVCQDEEDDSIDLEIFPPSMPSAGHMPANNNSSRRAQFILVQYDEEGNNRAAAVDNSDLFYPGVAAQQHHHQPYRVPDDHEPTDLNLDMQGEVSTSEDSGSGGQDEGAAHPHHAPPEDSSSNRHKRKLHSTSGRRKPKSWGSAMMKMVGFRTFSVLWKSEKKATDASSSRTKAHEDAGVPTQYAPPRFSVSSALEQTTPHRYSVSSQWEQTTPTRYANNDQVTPARFSGASLFDIESMDSRRFSTSSRGSPFTRPVINGENFNAAWKASKSSAHGRKMQGHTRDYDNVPKSPMKSPMKSPWKWFASFKSVATTPKEGTKDGSSIRQKAAALEPLPPAAVSPSQERRKSTSSMPASKVKAHQQQQPLTPVLTSKKSPWWKSSPIPKTPPKKSPLMIAQKGRDQEVNTDSQDDTPHRLSSASPMVGYSRSSSNGSSCFTTPRWNNRTNTRAQHGHLRGMAVHEREHEITHLAI